MHTVSHNSAWTHRVASLLKRWLLATHQVAFKPNYPEHYLDEFTFASSGGLPNPTASRSGACSRWLERPIPPLTRSCRPRQSFAAKPRSTGTEYIDRFRCSRRYNIAGGPASGRSNDGAMLRHLPVRRYPTTLPRTVALARVSESAAGFEPVGPRHAFCHR